MKNAILLHGRPSKAEYYDSKVPSASNAHWFPWLQKQLLIHDIKVDTPEVPLAFNPQWDLWVKEVERFDINLETILVGHSTGAGFWVRFLSEHPKISVDKVVLVAPWLNVKHEDSTSFFDFEIDPGIVEHTNKFVIFSSDNDGIDMINTTSYLLEHLPNAHFKNFHHYGHFCFDDLKTVEFPELLNELLN